MTAPQQYGSLAINIDDDVAVLAEQLEALRQLGEQEAVSDGELYNFSVQWGVALAGRLPRLAHYHARGSLTDADTRRFRLLCDEFRALSPIAARLGLVRPDLSPDAATDP